MKYWSEYVKHSYQIILEAEDRATISLPHEVEAWVVHAFARWMEQPNILDEPIAIKMMAVMNQQGTNRIQGLERLAEESMLVDGLKLNHRRWPSESYYRDMSMLALEYRAYSERPPELFYSELAKVYTSMVKVLEHCRSSGLSKIS